MLWAVQKAEQVKCSFQFEAHFAGEVHSLSLVITGCPYIHTLPPYSTNLENDDLWYTKYPTTCLGL